MGGSKEMEMRERKLIINCLNEFSKEVLIRAIISSKRIPKKSELIAIKWELIIEEFGKIDKIYDQISEEQEKERINK